MVSLTSLIFGNLKTMFFMETPTIRKNQHNYSLHAVLHQLLSMSNFDDYLK